MQVTLHFHGELRQFCPTGFTCWARSAAEAVNLFFRQNRHAARERDGSKRMVQVAGHCSVDTLTQALEVERLDVCPAFMGAGGSGGTGGIQAIIGAVLIVAGALMWGNPFSIPLIMMGLGLVIGGALQMLSPAPRLDRPDAILDGATGQTAEESRYLGAAGNTTASGTRIPLGYGRVKVFGHILSFDVEADPEPVLGQPPTADQRRRVGNVA